MHDVDEKDTRWAGLGEVLGMAFPIVMGSMSFTVMQFVDQVLVSRLGKDALAAVGSAGLWNFALATFLLGIVGCVSTFVSQSLGRNELDKCARYAWQGIYISLFTGLLALALWPFSGPLFGLMRHSEEVTRLEVIYFNVRLLGYVFMAWQATLTGFFQGLHRPLVPTIAGIIGNIVNAILAILLIFGLYGFPRWGVAGAAVATVIALGVQAAILQLVFMAPPLNRRYGTRAAYAIDWIKIWELFRIGWPAGLSFLIDVLSWGLFTSFLVGGFGTVALASHNVAVNFLQLAFTPAIGINQAIAPIVGRYVGMKDIRRAKARTYTATQIAMLYMFSVGLVMAVFGKALIWRFFSQDPEVIALGHTLLILAAVFQAFDAVNITVLGALRGAGDTFFVAVVMFVMGYLVFLPTATILAHVFALGAIGAWVGATIYIVVLSLILFVRFYREKWRHIQIFTADRAATVPAE